jgi:hypothetical protein
MLTLRMGILYILYKEGASTSSTRNEPANQAIPLALTLAMFARVVTISTSMFGAGWGELV